ncbi:MAG: ATP-binding protein [Anaerolineae bacterium]|nr:ATP-binding protein [Anaerolineae bacterium]MDW8171253.1 ATP-binding protein [Anaerolineae bacterium]
MPTSSNPEADEAESSVLPFVCCDPDDPSQPCPICGGHGFVRKDVPMSDSRWGKLHRCPNNRPETNRERQQRLRKLSNLDSLSSKTFDNFITFRPGYTTIQTNNLESNLRVVQGYAQNPQGWLLLEGGYGCGKTHLAAAVGNFCLARGQQVIFLTTPDLLDHLRSTYSPNSEVGYDELFERLRNVYLLILDDLGVENPSEWAQEKLYQLINHRYTTRQPTIFTTNGLTKKIDPRIASRLRDSFVIRVTFDVPDFRDTVTLSYTASRSRLHLYHTMTLDNFDANSHLGRDQYDNLKKVVGAAVEFSQKLNGWLMFIGEHGTGKTHLAAGIANYVSRQTTQKVLFFDVAELMSDLRSTFDSERAISADKLIGELQEADLLVLENIPADNPKSAWTQEKLFQILEVRYIRQSATVLTSFEPLEKLSARLRVRLLDQRMCRVFTILAPPFAMRRA